MAVQLSKKEKETVLSSYYNIKLYEIYLIDKQGKQGWWGFDYDYESFFEYDTGLKEDLHGMTVEQMNKYSRNAREEMKKAGVEIVPEF